MDLDPDSRGSIVLCDELKRQLSVIKECQELLLGNLALVSEIPAPTFNERERAEFMVERFGLYNSVEPEIDELNNVIGVIRNKNSTRNVLISTHVDTSFNTGSDAAININESHVFGAGVADDNTSIAVMLTLPEILDRLGYKPDFNLYMIAASRFHHRGDYEGIRKYVRGFQGKFDASININGLTLGNINYLTLSRIRCDIKCELQDNLRSVNVIRMSGGSAILTLNEVMDKLYRIPLSRKPRTLLNIGILSGGERYSTVSREARLGLEALSEDNEVMDKLIEEIKNICIDVGAKHNTKVTPEFFGRHTVASLSSSHPLVKIVMTTLEQLGISPKVEYTNSQMAVTLAEGIPSVNIGLTTGMGGKDPGSYIDIEPLSLGILQLLMILQAIDKNGEFRHE